MQGAEILSKGDGSLQNTLTVIDGSFGEGGGQVVRNAAAFAAIFHKNIRITNIRSGRSKPGLKSQHLTALKLLAEACDGSLLGGYVGSEEITFLAQSTARVESPGKVQPTRPITFTGDTKTAGSICLLLQAILPLALVTRRDILWILKGGTNTTMAPQYDYWEHIFLPTLRQCCQLAEDAIQPTIIRRGYFPRGGGEVQISTKHSSTVPLPPIVLKERGDVKDIWIRAFHAGKCPRSVPKQMAKAAEDFFKSQIASVPISTQVAFDESAFGSSSGILIVASTTTECRLGASALGSPKRSPSTVGIEAAEQLCSFLADGGCVDEYLQDQLILYMAVAKGTSEILTGPLTSHTRTAIRIAEQLSGARFRLEILGDKHCSPDSEGRIPGNHVIRCNGIGFSNPMAINQTSGSKELFHTAPFF